MAEKPDYEAGTASVALNGTTVTGVGTLWVAADIQPGDMFGAAGYPMTRVTVVNSNTSLTIEPWRGASLPAGSAYFIRYQPDGSRFTAALRTLVASISGGSLAALQAITGAADKIAYFTGPGAMALADFKDWGRSFLGLTMAADRMAYGTDANTMALTPLTVAGRALSNVTGTPTGNQGVFVTSGASSALFDFTAVGRALVGNANTADMRSYIGAQAAASSLTALSGIATATFGISLLAQANASDARTTLGAQPASSNLSALAAGTGSVSLGYRAGNVLGTVSQSSGVPTGSVIESGSNANGSYTKFADGTMYCWITGFSVPATDAATGSLFQSASSATWTFPVPFVGQPVCSPGSSNQTGAWIAVLLTSTTTASVRAMSSVTNATSQGVRLMALGRWF